MKSILELIFIGICRLFDSDDPWSRIMWPITLLVTGIVFALSTGIVDSQFFVDLFRKIEP